MGNKMQLQQIKTFSISEYSSVQKLDEDVNNYVVEFFNKHGNFPTIKTNSKSIHVVGNQLREVEDRK